MIEELFSVLADMESFSEMGDDLSSLIADADDGELDENDLTFVSAATQPPPYRDFLNRYRK